MCQVDGCRSNPIIKIDPSQNISFKWDVWGFKIPVSPAVNAPVPGLITDIILATGSPATPQNPAGPKPSGKNKGRRRHPGERHTPHPDNLRLSPEPGSQAGTAEEKRPFSSPSSPLPAGRQPERRYGRKGGRNG